MKKFLYLLGSRKTYKTMLVIIDKSKNVLQKLKLLISLIAQEIVLQGKLKAANTTRNRI